MGRMGISSRKAEISTIFTNEHCFFSAAKAARIETTTE
jgi:hypothetical protein